MLGNTIEAEDYPALLGNAVEAEDYTTLLGNARGCGLPRVAR